MNRISRLRLLCPACLARIFPFITRLGVYVRYVRCKHQWRLPRPGQLAIEINQPRFLRGEN